MKTIALTQNKEVIVDDEDYTCLIQFNWCAHRRGRKRINWYALRNVPYTKDFKTKDFKTKYKTRGMHQDIAAIIGLSDIDHRDGNGLNNQRNSLRPATHQQNQRNQQKQTGTTSKFKSVSWQKKPCKWVAKITVNEHQVHLGLFTDEIEAANAYNQAADRLFGDFAKKNDI